MGDDDEAVDVDVDGERCGRFACERERWGRGAVVIDRER